MNLGAHANFIIAAYGVGILVIAGLVAWVLLDHAAQRRAIAALEAGGAKRRSERT